MYTRGIRYRISLIYCYLVFSICHLDVRERQKIQSSLWKIVIYKIFYFFFLSSDILKKKIELAWVQFFNDAGKETRPLLLIVWYHMKIQKSLYLQDVDTMDELAFH